ncbi:MULTISPECIES: universal stress protein [Methanobrevibacter]|uniref:Nucleotide-binding universal stress UspA family protein n=1 Tax=Methanobrevibacter gottschalkii DSM 11977 TaxID=1122229 RepID=A0A3N5B3W4_9EURY|nr:MULTISPECIES: universal stress protein [Methanobrevibacter]OEC97289.1 adenine nucleotide alpha hydrolase [Methanobrevibacter sp. A27]RPF52003.1 nucleotide-binding universal stress UspA family protein [Methanobrevibacter gottschalkii DSM 11977]
MYKKILLPTDGSGYADQEIDRVTRLINEDGEIIILSVAPKLSTSAFQRRKDIEQLNKTFFEEAEDVVEKMKNKFPENYNIKTITKYGFPAETITNTAKEEGAELIVISASGKSGIHQFVIGSVAEKVLKLSEIDVLLVHNK